MNLSGNTILITGGGSGIGLAFAKAFSERSNQVIICGRNLKKLERVKKKYPMIDYFSCDINNNKNLTELFNFIKNNYPKINVLINNAGIQFNYKFDDLTNHSDLIEEEININFTAQLKLTDRLLPRLLKQSEAAIVNVTSLLAIIPKQSAPVYCASKTALRSFTQTLRYQLEDSSVNIFEVVPPLVDTKMTEGRGKGKISPDELVQQALKGMSANQYEIHIGKTKIMYFMQRLMPALAKKLIRNG